MGNRKELVVDIICALFVLLFLYAALTKLLEYEKFRVQLGQSPMLTAFTGVVAWAVPAVELVIVLLFIFKRTRLGALYASLGLMVMFTCYIVAITQFSDYVPCSCGGVISTLSHMEHLMLNLIFVVLAGVAIVLHPPASNKHTLTSPELGVNVTR